MGNSLKVILSDVGSKSLEEYDPQLRVEALEDLLQSQVEKIQKLDNRLDFVERKKGANSDETHKVGSRLLLAGVQLLFLEELYKEETNGYYHSTESDEDAGDSEGSQGRSSDDRRSAPQAGDAGQESSPSSTPEIRRIRKVSRQSRKDVGGDDEISGRTVGEGGSGGASEGEDEAA